MKYLKFKLLDNIGLTQKISQTLIPSPYGDAKGEGVLGVLGGSFFHNSA
jgi:hypothetical protein